MACGANGYLPETPPPSPASFINREGGEEEDVVNRVANPIMIVDDDGNDDERLVIENNRDEIPVNPPNNSSYKQLVIDLREEIESYRLQLDAYKESVKREKDEKMRIIREKEEWSDQCEKLKIKVTALVATEKALYDKIKKMEEISSHTWTQRLFVDDLNNCSTDEDGTNDTDIESVGNKSDDMGSKKKEKPQQNVTTMQQQQQQQHHQRHQQQQQQYQQLELQRDCVMNSHIPIEYQSHQHLQHLQHPHRYYHNRCQQPTNIRQPAFAFQPPYPISSTHIPYYGQYPHAPNHGMYGHPMQFMCGPRPYSWYMSPSNIGMGSR